VAVAARGRRGAVGRAIAGGGGPRSQVGEVQRVRIIAGAVEAVAESGYAGLTVAAVIGRAKISRRTFYELFEDREDCFLAAFDEALARARAPILEAYGGGGTWRERIGAGLLALLAFCDEQPRSRGC
jgi:AcrR family transcriptional regulator